MAKPYWRVKRGKTWVFVPAKILIFNEYTQMVQIELPKEEEE